MEVSGSVGNATRLARTVIIGEDMKFITNLLYVLTYFVRCSVVQKKTAKGKCFELNINRMCFLEKP